MYPVPAVRIFHFQDGGDVTNPMGLSPCMPRKCKSGPMPPSRAKQWRQKSANPALFPRMSPGSTPRDGRWWVHNFYNVKKKSRLSLKRRSAFRIGAKIYLRKKKYFGVMGTLKGRFLWMKGSGIRNRGWKHVKCTILQQMNSSLSEFWMFLAQEWCKKQILDRHIQRLCSETIQRCARQAWWF